MRAAALARILSTCASRENPQRQQQKRKVSLLFLVVRGASLKCNIGCIIYEGGERCAADHLFPESSLGTHAPCLGEHSPRRLLFAFRTISLLARFDFCARMSLPVHQLVLTPTDAKFGAPHADRYMNAIWLRYVYAI